MVKNIGETGILKNTQLVYELFWKQSSNMSSKVFINVNNLCPFRNIRNNYRSEINCWLEGCSTD